MPLYPAKEFSTNEKAASEYISYYDASPSNTSSYRKVLYYGVGCNSLRSEIYRAALSTVTTYFSCFSLSIRGRHLTMTFTDSAADEAYVKPVL